MTRRAWWLVLLNVLIPGSAQILAGRRGLGRFALVATGVFWLLVIGLGVWFVLARDGLLGFLLGSWALTAVQIFAVAYAVLWVILALDTLRLARLPRARAGARPLVLLVSVALMVTTSGVAVGASTLASSTRTALGKIFPETAAEAPSEGRYNILLLGGDAGPDREGLRPDSLSVISIDALSGRATTIGLPRDMLNVPFAEGSPMRERYPDGYRRCDVSVCKLNSVYTEAEVWHADWFPEAAGRNSTPGIEATRDAAEGILGMRIPYFALIDMQGFADLIDALGGVDITVTERVPIGGDEQLNGVAEWIEPGEHHMSGYYAQWYARARHGSSDFDRMTRQRELQNAIIDQFDPITVLTRFPGIADAGAQIVRTDIPASMVGIFVGLAAQARAQGIDSIELTPANGVDQERPDFDAIRSLVAERLATPAG